MSDFSPINHSAALHRAVTAESQQTAPSSLSTGDAGESVLRLDVSGMSLSDLGGANNYAAPASQLQADVEYVLNDRSALG